MRKKITISLPGIFAMEMKKYARGREQSFSALVRLALKKFKETDSNG